MLGLMLLSLAVAATAVVAARAMAPRDDVVDSPDAVAVLGGAGQERADLGIELRQRYGVPLILSSSAQRFALRRGVDCRTAICIRTDPETTAGEARGIADLANEHGWDEVVVVTTDFHTTRARILFRQCLGDRVRVVGASPEDGRGPGLRRWLNEVGGIVAGTTFRRAC